jgi:hypothetical protein
MVPHCTGCGAIRAPLSGPSVNMAGKPFRFGGAVVRAAGGVVLVGGLLVALAVAGLLYVLAPLAAAMAVAIPMALLSVAIGIALLWGGRRMGRSGDLEEHATRQRAVLAMAEERGSVTAVEAAQILGISAAEADRSLTDLAKREPDRMVVDVDEQGVIRYRCAFPRVAVDVRIATDAAGASSDALEADRAEWQSRIRR